MACRAGEKELNNFNRRLEKNPLVASRVIDGAVLLVPIRQPGPEIKKVYRLKDPVASRIWQLINGRSTIRQIQKRICEEFETEAQRAEKDLRRFLKHLERIGAIVVMQTSVQRRASS